ncbi:MAG: DUF2335 domain-containing protein [Calditrichaeota bacterium]|nr:MAG: DUF2335 domain-containing protein [Calditrichota bacterium]
MPRKPKQSSTSKTNRNKGKLQHRSSDSSKKEVEKSESADDRNARIIAAASRFSGPLPPPEVLGAYDKILPGAAERILKMAEREQRVSNEIDIKLAKYVGRGQLFGFLLGLVTILGGILLIYVGKDVGGLTSLLAGLGALLLAYLHGQKESNETEK